MVFRSCISTGKRLSYYCILMLVFFSGFMKSSVVYAASLCTSLRFETMIWRSKLIRFQISLSVQNFKKPLDIFSVTANRKKASRRTFSHSLDCKGKVLKIKTVNCLCECFTELYLFFWLLVVSFTVLIAVPVVFRRTWTSLAGGLNRNSKCRAYQTPLKITHTKTIK